MPLITSSFLTFPISESKTPGAAKTIPVESYAMDLAITFVYIFGRGMGKLNADGALMVRMCEWLGELYCSPMNIN